MTNRCFAKAIDLCIIFFLSLVLPHPLGVLLGLIYVLIHDGLPGGQSLGKRLFHLKTILIPEGAPCTYRQSAIRNAPLGVATFFGIIPFWGWFLAIFLGIPMVAIEVYLMWTRDHRSRLGDVMADTHVVSSGVHGHE